jgi:glycosyltransferase involved in cell wall biosynthesis
MAMGIVPVVVDYAGPGELVTDEVGYKIPLGPRKSIVDRFRRAVTEICDSPSKLRDKSIAARARIQDLFTWEAKARQMMEIYDWVRGGQPTKPEFRYANDKSTEKDDVALS